MPFKKRFATEEIPSLLLLCTFSAAVCHSAANSQSPNTSQKEYDQAIQGGSYSLLKHLNKAVQLNPNSETAYFSRAIHWMNQGQRKEAIADFSRAIALNPKNYRSYNFRASCYAGLKNWPAALKDYTKQIELSPNSISPYRNRAYVYQQLGLNDRARQDMKMFENLREGLQLPIGDTARIHKIELYTKHLKTNPNDRNVYLRRATLYMYGKDYRSAAKDFTSALNLDPEKSKQHINYNLDQIHYDRATCYENLHEYAKAVEDYGQILAMDEDAEEAYFYRGECHFKLGHFEKAVSDYTQSIKYDIDHLPKPYLARGRAYEKLGKPDLARRDFQKAKELKR